MQLRKDIQHMQELQGYGKRLWGQLATIHHDTQIGRSLERVLSLECVLLFERFLSLECVL